MTTIVSMSSVPTRFGNLYPVLEHLLAQDIKPDEVRLYIPKAYRRFPDYDGSLPDVPKGVRIMRTDDDLGPGSKVLFAARDLRGEDADIFFCDDDMLYAPDWFSRMRDQRRDRLDHCITTLPGHLAVDGKPVPIPRDPQPVWGRKGLPYRRARLGQIWRKLRGGPEEVKPGWVHVKEGGYVNIAQGIGAVLVRPEMFDEDFYDIPPVLWTVDDYWISGLFAAKGTPIWSTEGFVRPIPTESNKLTALFKSVVDGANRVEANAACVRYMQDTYGIWQTG